MDLYIKGLQKPKSCIECYFSGFTKGKGTVCLIDGTRLTALLDENMTAKYVRASVCPLMPIPDHGDLIDRDKLIGDMKMIFGEETLVTMRMNTKGFKSTIKSVPKDPMIECLCNLAEFVKLSPVVIPAERKER